MADVKDDAKGGGFHRIEVLTGPGRRRRWSDDDKARIVAETLEPGAVVSEVARRWQVCAQQVFGWRRGMRRGAVTPTAPLNFVPIVPAPPPAGPEPSSSATPTPSPPAPPVEVELAGAVLRIPPGTDVHLLTAVLRAIRASAT